MRSGFTAVVLAGLDTVSIIKMSVSACVCYKGRAQSLTGGLNRKKSVKMAKMHIKYFQHSGKLSSQNKVPSDLHDSNKCNLFTCACASLFFSF